MCGDGTNDVGALKAAHVGVSIVNDPDFERKIEGVRDSSSLSTTATGKKTGSKNAKGTSAKDRTVGPTSHHIYCIYISDHPIRPELLPSCRNRRRTPLSLSWETHPSPPPSLPGGRPSTPFSLSSDKVSFSSLHIISLIGRCTLVTTIQVYKILALNCLVSAYMVLFIIIYHLF